VTKIDVGDGTETGNTTGIRTGTTVSTTSEMIIVFGYEDAMKTNDATGGGT
jgi:hypothetical protein